MLVPSCRPENSGSRIVPRDIILEIREISLDIVQISEHIPHGVSLRDIQPCGDVRRRRVSDFAAVILGMDLRTISPEKHSLIIGDIRAHDSVQFRVSQDFTWEKSSKLRLRRDTKTMLGTSPQNHVWNKRSFLGANNVFDGDIHRTILDRGRNDAGNVEYPGISGG